MMKWTRDHKSQCGRFWLYKAPRADEWEIFDRARKDAHGASFRCGRFRKLADAKRYCEVIQAQHPAHAGRPLIDIL